MADLAVQVVDHLLRIADRRLVAPGEQRRGYMRPDLSNTLGHMPLRRLSKDIR
jgi:hypothetical protein